MNKIIAFLLAICILCGCFSSCNSRKDSTPITVEQIKSTLKRNFNGCSIIEIDHASLNQEGAFYRALYRTENTPHELLELSEGWIILSLRDDGYEVQLLRAKHRSDRVATELLLRRRLDYIKSAEIRKYMGAEYERYLSSAAVYCYGNWVVLLATGENDEILKKLKNIL